MEKAPAKPRGIESRHRVMIDTIPNLAWSCQPDGTTEFFNQRWLDYTGFPLEEAQGWGWKAAIHLHLTTGILASYTGDYRAMAFPRIGLQRTFFELRTVSWSPIGM